MGFGKSKQEKSALSTMGDISSQFQGLGTQQAATGQSLIGAGTRNVDLGTNFFNTLLTGNAANTAALLSPQVNQMRDLLSTNLTQASTLMPRGGGRTASLFDIATRPTGAITDMYNQARMMAPQFLTNTGLSQIGSGANVFGTGTSALGSALTGQGNIFQNEFQARQAKLKSFMDLGQGIFNLASTPMGASGQNLFQRLPFK